MPLGIALLELAGGVFGGDAYISYGDNASIFYHQRRKNRECDMRINR